MSQPRTSVAPASPQRRSLSVRGRLFSLVAVLCSLWLVSVGVAVSGLSGPRSQVDSLAVSFEVSNDPSRAYESWLSDDSASNMYVALASLNDSKQAKLIESSSRRRPSTRSPATCRQRPTAAARSPCRSTA